MNNDRARSNNARAAGRPAVWTRADDDRTTDQTRFTVAQAAEMLGLSAEAVRSRVQRGTLESEKVGGTVYVLLEDTTQTRPNTDETTDDTRAQTPLSGDQTEFIASLHGQIEWLRREVERKDTLLMTLMQRVPELDPVREGASESREAPETASEGKDRGEVPPEPQEPSQRRSWWRRFFGVE